MFGQPADAFYVFISFDFPVGHFRTFWVSKCLQKKKGFFFKSQIGNLFLSNTIQEKNRIFTHTFRNSIEASQESHTEGFNSENSSVETETCIHWILDRIQRRRSASHFKILLPAYSYSSITILLQNPNQYRAHSFIKDKITVGFS